MAYDPIPAAGQLVDWLRREAKKYFEEPRGDFGDFFALLWLTRLIDSGDPNSSRLLFAVENLLGENDPVVTRRLLEVLHEAPPAYRSAVARAIGAHAARLRALDDTPSTSMLGLAVRPLVTGRLAEPVPAATLDELAKISDARDGWPQSAQIGLLHDYPRFADQLIPTLERASDQELASLILGFASTGDNTVTQDGFEKIGREASPATRARVAAAVKKEVESLGRSRALMKQMGIQFARSFDPPDVEWARYAARLGVAP